MQMEPIYHIDNTIDESRGLYWFCRVPDCDGYGGPVKTASKKQEISDQKQFSLFE